jgi:hypothetical protein
VPIISYLAGAMRKKIVLPALALLCGCGSEQDALVGRWRAADGPNLEFFADGTVNIGGDRPVGARYQITDEGLQIQQDLVGPVVVPMGMMGDSFTVEGKGVLGRGRLTFFRDTGGQAPTHHTLAGEPAGRGSCRETRRLFSGGSKTEQVALEAAFRGGELVLDPLTHSFTQTVAMELREAKGINGQMVRAQQLSGRYRGRYEEQGGKIMLRYQDAGTLVEVTGQREGERITLPGQPFLQALAARGGQSRWLGFHTGSAVPHELSWGEMPELTYEVKAE